MVPEDSLAQTGDQPEICSKEKIVRCKEIKEFIRDFGLPVLGNATVGKQYDQDAYPEQAKEALRGLLEKGLQLRFAQLNSLGLEFDSDSLKLKGTPGVAGDHEEALEFTYDEGSGDVSIVMKKYRVFVNSDPRSLWKEREPEPGLPYSKPHTDCRREDHGEAVLVGASRRGRSHAHKGTFRDDDFAIADLGDGWSLVAVADGAGSARFSRKGSQILCEEIKEQLQGKIPSNLKGDFEGLLRSYCQDHDEEKHQIIRSRVYNAVGKVVHKAAVTAIANEATKAGAERKEFATTLVLTLTKRFDFGWFTTCFAIGDGGAALIVDPKARDIRILNCQDSGEFSGQTKFVTMSALWDKPEEELLPRVRFQIAENPVALIAMTDGVSDPKFKTDRDFENPEQWVKFWDELTSVVVFERGNSGVANELLDWLDFWEEGEHDDRTIAVLVMGGSND